MNNPTPHTFKDRWLFDGVLIDPSPKTPYVLVEEFISGARSYGFCFLEKQMRCMENKSNLGHLEEAVIDSMVAEGSYIIDQRKIPIHIGRDGFLSGPVVNVLLPPHTIDRLSFGKKTFASLNEAMNYGSTTLPLTEVSLDIYTTFWRKLGARIGRKVKGSIKWETYHLLN